MTTPAPALSNKIVLRKVVSIAADIFEVPESTVGPQSSPDTIATWDSLHHLSLVLALEQEFGVEFSPEEIEQLLSIELTEAALQEKLKGCAIPDGH